MLRRGEGGFVLEGGLEWRGEDVYSEEKFDG